MSEVVPIKLDLSDCDFDEEAEEEAVEESKKGRFLTLPVILSIGGCIGGIVAIIFAVLMFSKNGLPSFGKPSLDNVTMSDKESAAHGGADELGRDEHEFEDITTYEVDHSDKKKHGADKKKPTKSNDKIGKIVQSGDGSIFFLNPVAVSVPVNGGMVHFYVTLAFETDKDTANALFEKGADVKEELAAVLKAMDTEAAHHWDAPHHVRSQIRRRLEAMIPDAKIETVLVQDFVVF